MPTYTEPLKTWNKIVKDTIEIRLQQINQVSPNQLVDSVKKGRDYQLRLVVKNTSDVELIYENVEIRIVGQSDQLDFTAQGAAIDYNGRPRQHFNTGRMAAGDRSAR